ncbi:MAG: hypothetical protein LIV24_01195 [Eubacterium sp.]|nr:hypothetical protein [Eubacterium sp.]
MAVCIYIYQDNKPDNAVLGRICGGIYDSPDVYSDRAGEVSSYLRMKQKLSEEGGIIITSSIYNLGRSNVNILKELEWMLKHRITLAITDYPITTQIDSMTNRIALKTLIDVFRKLTDKPLPSDLPVRHSHAGRKKIPFPDNWEVLYPQWQAKKITAVEFMQKAGVRKGTFYHLVKEYQKKQGESRRRNDSGK